MPKPTQIHSNPLQKLRKSIASSLEGTNVSLGITLTALVTLLSFPLYLILPGLFAFITDTSVNSRSDETALIFIAYSLLIIASALIAGALGTLGGKFKRKRRAFMTLSLLSVGCGLGLLCVFMLIGAVAIWL